MSLGAQCQVFLDQKTLQAIDNRFLFRGVKFISLLRLRGASRLPASIRGLDKENVIYLYFNNEIFALKPYWSMRFLQLTSRWHHDRIM